NPNATGSKIFRRTTWSPTTTHAKMRSSCPSRLRLRGKLCPRRIRVPEARDQSMQHPQNEHRRSDRSEDGSLRSATATGPRPSQPRGPLQHGDEAEDGDDDPHPRHRTVNGRRSARLAWGASAALVGVFALLALGAEASPGPV